MSNEPERWVQRGLAALVMLVAAAYGAHLIFTWLMPLVPALVVVLVLLVIARWVFTRR